MNNSASSCPALPTSVAALHTNAPARRRLLQGAATSTLLTLWEQASAQEGSRVVELRGQVLRNGQPLTLQNHVAAGDHITTGPGAQAVFTVGNSAFLLRENTRLELQGDAPWAVRVLRLLTGAVASVWGRGSDRQILTPALTAGIRGTGVYAEVFPQEDFRSYFCNCYGTVDLSAGGEQLRSESEYHQSYWAEVRPRNGRMLIPADAMNHTDEEMEMLAALVQQRTTWQITGRKGSHGSKPYGSGSYGSGSYGRTPYRPYGAPERAAPWDSHGSPN